MIAFNGNIESYGLQNSTSRRRPWGNPSFTCLIHFDFVDGIVSFGQLEAEIVDPDTPLHF